MDDSQWMPPDPNRRGPNPPPPPVPHAGPSSEPSPPPVLPPVPSSPWSSAAQQTPTPSVDAVSEVTSPEAASYVPTVGGREPGRSRRSRVLVGGGVVAVLAVGAAGVFAVRQYSGSTQGGAANPTELGAELMTAIEQEDVLGMVDTLVPGERDVMRDPLIDLVAELTRLDVLAEGADLSSIAGFDVELASEAVIARGTNVDDIVNVDMRADATVMVDGSVVPIGELITDNMDPDDLTELRGSSETSTEEFEATLTAVELDGRWYFSLFHSLAEELRADVEPVPDIPVEGIGADGAESPEAAFDQLLDRTVALDVAGVIQTLNPGEAAALQRYAPIFLDEVDAAVAELPAYELSIDSRDVRVEGEGARRTVFIDGLSGSGSFGEPGEQVRFEFDWSGDCVHASIEGDGIDSQQFDECTSDLTSQPDLQQALEDAPAIKELLAAIEEALADMQPAGLELRQVEGKWYVSPITTGTEAVLKFLRALDRQEIDHLIELGAASGEEIFDLALGGMLGLGDDPYGEFSAETPAETVATMPDFPDESATPTTEVATWDRCYNESAAADAAACFEEYVASGDIDESFIPVALRFPECGYAELSWSSEIYSLSDAEFMAAADAARPCFMALLAAGSVEEYELPYEITRPECFEGRNWYATFDDPEYDERYWACIENELTAGADTAVVATTAPPG